MITAQLDESDFVSAQSLHRRWSRRKTLVAILVVLIAGALGLYLLCQGMYSAGCGMIGGVIGGAIGGSVVRYLYVPWKARRVFRQQKSLQREFELYWSDEGMRVKDTNGEYSSAWSDFVRWKEDDRLFLVYLSDIAFYMVPKRAFPASSEVQGFRNKLASGVDV
jgi:hypothetical protein